MNIAIIGGWDYALSEGDIRFLNAALRLLEKATIVTDGQGRFAAAAEMWALQHSFPVMQIPVDRASYGREAVAFNQGEMLRHANAVVAFPGGPGTDALVAKATRSGVAVFESPSRLCANPGPRAEPSGPRSALYARVPAPAAMGPTYFELEAASREAHAVASFAREANVVVQDEFLTGGQKYLMLWAHCYRHGTTVEEQVRNGLSLETGFPADVLKQRDDEARHRNAQFAALRTATARRRLAAEAGSGPAPSATGAERGDPAPTGMRLRP